MARHYSSCDREAGKIKLLVVTNSVRAPTLPNIPTATEAGHPELAFDGLVGFFGPPGMPLDLRERIAVDVRAVTDAIIESLITTGQIVNLGGPVEFATATEQQRAIARAQRASQRIRPTPYVVSSASLPDGCDNPRLPQRAA
jgi:tripartite-type tricarboxylate transporter receptor subunit TctC